MAREYFPAYHSYLESMEELTDAEKGRLFTACLIYSKTGEAPQLSGNERYVFPTFRSQIERDNAEYARRCATNKKNGELGGYRAVSNGGELPHSVPNAPQEKGKEKGKGEGKENTLSPTGEKSNRRFAPPSVSEVEEYCRERRNGVDAEQFVNFYAAKGWKVGNQPMKDWKAAVRTWEKRRNEDPRRTGALGDAVDQEDQKPGNNLARMRAYLQQSREMKEEQENEANLV